MINKIGVFLFHTTNLQTFLANNFFWVHFFPIISTDLKSACVFDIHIQNKFWGSLRVFFGTSRMQIRKKWPNQLKKKKTFLANILKNIIWHLFAGESHQVVKIAVTP
jgi:hypothetical protein